MAAHGGEPKICHKIMADGVAGYGGSHGGLEIIYIHTHTHANTHTHTHIHTHTHTHTQNIYKKTAKHNK